MWALLDCGLAEWVGGCVRAWVEDVVAGDPTGSGLSANSGLELTLFRHRHRHRHRHGHGHGHGQSCNSSNVLTYTMLRRFFESLGVFCAPWVF